MLLEIVNDRSFRIAIALEIERKTVGRYLLKLFCANKFDEKLVANFFVVPVLLVKYVLPFVERISLILWLRASWKFISSGSDPVKYVVRIIYKIIRKFSGGERELSVKKKQKFKTRWPFVPQVSLMPIPLRIIRYLSLEIRNEQNMRSATGNVSYLYVFKGTSPPLRCRCLHCENQPWIVPHKLRVKHFK